ncbi:MAG: lipopolysaccharide heptosyltransferase II [Candidatus Eisenbacteria sp.]|nr:lipopolysaccharide heptosyltransferase II [Candidatus Eisenbacteria bacterium]
MRTLLRLPNWVGDTLLALPALEGCALAAEADLVLAGRRLPLELTAHICPEAPRLLLKKGRGPGLTALAAVRALRKTKVPRAIIFTPSFSSALQAYLAAIERRIGWVEQGRGLLLTEAVERPARGVMHLSAEFCELARRAGAESFPELPVLPPADDARAKVHAFLQEHSPTLAGRSIPGVALCPGVQYGAAKQWPVAHFRHLRKSLEAQGIGGVVIGSRAERQQAQQVLGGAGPTWSNAAGEGSLVFSAELLRDMDAAVCNDTGSMHLAAAVGTRVVAIFGSTDPAWTRPLGVGHRVLCDNWECAPCFRRDCPRGDPAPCMAEITPERVGQTVLELLADAHRSGGRSRSRVRRGLAASIRSQHPVQERDVRTSLSAGSSADPASAELGEKSAPDQRGKAIFLDRDGTICELVAYLRAPEQVRLLPGVGPSLRDARGAGFRLVVVTNQSGIARGYFSREEVDAVHAELQRQLRLHAVQIDRFYICLHHPDHTGPCACRKPEPGMLLEAIADLDLDPGRSFMIGDTREDLLAGLAAGCHPVLVRTGYGREVHLTRGGELPPDTMVADDLPSAIRRILASSVDRSGPEP